MISIDGSVIIQIANFLILIWILNLVLYKPIRNIIIQRKEKISGLESDIDSAETKAVEQDQAFADGIKDARAKGLKQKEVLLQAAADEEKALIGQINEKAQAELTKIREQIAGEANDAKQALMKDVDSFASAISEKILGRAV
jgi:F-type H+-transporting ATPase subunit b